MLNMKRSSCASGSGYVPSSSIGFCVASTKNGRSSGYVRPAAVTWYSCIASSSAACVFGGVRLISSARRICAKIGPFTKRSDAVAALLVEHFGAGDVGRHQVGRELDPLERQVEDLRDRLDQQRLGQAGHAGDQAVAAGEERHQHLVDDLVLADDDLADLGEDPLAALRRRARRPRRCPVGGRVHQWVSE